MQKLSCLLWHDKTYAFEELALREVSDWEAMHGFTKEELHEIMATNNKQRYEFSEDMTHLRAMQGHSIQVDAELVEAILPNVLYHGTAKEFTDSIMKQVILKGKRLYVQLSTSIEMPMKIGQRHGEPVVITIDAKRMSKDGINFFLSRNGIWLTEFVDASILLGICLLISSHPLDIPYPMQYRVLYFCIE